LEATPTRGLMALVPAAAAKQEGEGSHVPLRLARLRSLVGGRREQCPWLDRWSLAPGRVRMFGRRGAGELRKVEIAGPGARPVSRCVTASDQIARLGSEFGKQSTALDLVGLGVDKRNGIQF